jgi:hypothetical protein
LIKIKIQKKEIKAVGMRLESHDVTTEEKRKKRK